MRTLSHSIAIQRRSLCFARPNSPNTRAARPINVVIALLSFLSIMLQHFHHFVTNWFRFPSAAAVGGRRGYPQAPAFKLDARAPRINRTPGAGEGNSRLAIDTTYPAYLTGSALNRPSRRAAVYHAFLMQCAYTRNSAQCERAAGGPRPSRPQAAQTARAAACADRSH